MDDFAAWRSYVRSVLKERENFQVLGEAVDGQEAIEKATQLQPDLVVMDVAMPKMNGTEAAKQRVALGMPKYVLEYRPR